MWATKLSPDLLKSNRAKKSDRPKLREAFWPARKTRQNTDRQTRPAQPQCGLFDDTSVGMMVTFAQYEAERTSERTIAALTQKKLQGFKPGKPENLTLDDIRTGQVVRSHNAAKNKANVLATELALLYRSKHYTYAQIAES